MIGHFYYLHTSSSSSDLAFAILEGDSRVVVSAVESSGARRAAAAAAFSPPL